MNISPKFFCFKF